VVGLKGITTGSEQAAQSGTYPQDPLHLGVEARTLGTVGSSIAWEAIQELTSVGVRFISITQGIDTDQSNPMARFLTTILAAVAEMEREMIRERVMTGIRAAQAAGIP
jgi:hypothetical protein